MSVTHDIVITMRPMSSSVVLIIDKLLHFNILDHLLIKAKIGRNALWVVLYFFLYRKSTTETRGVNREFYVVVVLCI